MLLQRFDNVVSWLIIHRTQIYEGWSGYAFTKLFENKIAFYISINPQTSEVPYQYRMQVQNLVFDARPFSELLTQVDDFSRIREGRNGSVTIHTDSFTLNLQSGCINVYINDQTGKLAQAKSKSKKKNKFSLTKPKTFSWSNIFSKLYKKKHINQGYNQMNTNSCVNHPIVTTDVHQYNQPIKQGYSQLNTNPNVNTPVPVEANVYSENKMDFQKFNRQQEYNEYLDPKEWNPARNYPIHDWERNNRARAIQLGRLDPKEQNVGFVATTQNEIPQQMYQKTDFNQQIKGHYNHGVNIYPFTQPGQTFEVIQEPMESPYMQFHNQNYFTGAYNQQTPLQNNEFHYVQTPDQIAPVQNDLYYQNKSYDQITPNKNNETKEAQNYLAPPPRPPRYSPNIPPNIQTKPIPQHLKQPKEIVPQQIHQPIPPPKPQRQFLYPANYFDQFNVMKTPQTTKQPLILDPNRAVFSPRYTLVQEPPVAPVYSQVQTDTELLKNTETIAERKNKLNKKISETIISESAPVSKLKIPEKFKEMVKSTFQKNDQKKNEGSSVNTPITNVNNSPTKESIKNSPLKKPIVSQNKSPTKESIKNSPLKKPIVSQNKSPTKKSSPVKNTMPSLDSTTKATIKLDDSESKDISNYLPPQFSKRDESKPCCSKDLETDYVPDIEFDKKYEIGSSSSAESFESVIRKVPDKVNLNDTNVMNRSQDDYDDDSINFETLERSRLNSDLNLSEPLEKTVDDLNFESLDEADICDSDLNLSEPLEKTVDDLNFESLGEADICEVKMKNIDDVFKYDQEFYLMIGEIAQSQKRLQSSIESYMKDHKNKQLRDNVFKSNALCRGTKQKVNRELAAYESNRLAKAYQILDILTDSGSGNERSICDYVKQAYRYDDESDISSSLED